MKKSELFEKAEREFTPLCRLNSCKAHIGYFYIDGIPVYALKSYNTITAVAFICKCPVDGEFCWTFERDYYSATSSQHLSKFIRKISKVHCINFYRVRFSMWRGNRLTRICQQYHINNGWQDAIEYAINDAIFFDVDKIKGV